MIREREITDAQVIERVCELPKTYEALNEFFVAFAWAQSHGQNPPGLGEFLIDRLKTLYAQAEEALINEAAGAESDHYADQGEIA